VVTLLLALSAGAEPVRVRHPEGIVHGFLALRTLDGTRIADGDLIQNVAGTRVTSRLVFHFKDGSTHDEEAVFSQQQDFRLIRDHLVQKGPSFPQPLDMTIDAAAGTVRVAYDEHGRQKVETKQMALPSDLANGLILTLLKNVRPAAPPQSLSFVAAMPSPRLVRLDLSTATAERFSTGGASRTAVDYVLTVNLGGVQGVLARLLHKQPPDSHVWILEGDAPAFIRSEQQLYPGGPLWRIELVSPAFTAP
jgi:hypothetical protein